MEEREVSVLVPLNHGGLPTRLVPRIDGGDGGGWGGGSVGV